MNYYIIGSKYGSQAEGFEDILPKMLDKGVIATGFNMYEDMRTFIGESQSNINNHLNNKSEGKESYPTLKHFLNLKPGDLVAVKIHSAPSRKQARLVIGAYAIVKGIDSPIYKHCEELGHTIEVDFIEKNLDYELPLGYGQTIHKIEDLERIELIFSYYSNHVAASHEANLDLDLKNTDDVAVDATAGYIASRAHNIIQNKLIVDLSKKYGSACVKKEKNYIDVLVELDDKFILYEVKSSLSANQCIREALGQIMQYGHSLKKTSNKSIEYVVVGPSEVDDSDSSFYSYIANIIDAPVAYLRVFA